MGFEDTFKKQIDEIGKVLIQLLTGLLGLKSQGNENEGMDLVKQTLNEKTQLNFDEMLRIPADQIADFLRVKNCLNIENIDKLADIFYELADGLYVADKATSLILFERSLALYEFLSENESTYSIDRHFKMEDIRSVLKQNT